MGPVVSGHMVREELLVLARIRLPGYRSNAQCWILIPTCPTHLFVVLNGKTEHSLFHCVICGVNDPYHPSYMMLEWYHSLPSGAVV